MSRQTKKLSKKQLKKHEASFRDHQAVVGSIAQLSIRAGKMEAEMWQSIINDLDLKKKNHPMSMDWAKGVISWEEYDEYESR